MSEQSFYQRVLPSVGPYCVFIGATGPDGKLVEQRHYNGLSSIEDLEKKVQELSLLPVNIFFAVGSYGSPNRRDPIAKRSFYLDLDSKDFGSVEAALRELSTFVRATGLPPPSLYVHSGRGMHVYWCLDQDLPIARWSVVAAALKARCVELNFRADPAVTADAARILRCPGTLNRKEQTPIPCSVMAGDGHAYAIERIEQQLQVSLSSNSAATKLAGLANNDDLNARRDFETKTASEVADILDHIDLPERAGRDLWITVLCGIQDWGDKSIESFELFHDWSSSQPGYESREDCWRTWDSFSPGGGIGIGTLIKLARDAGYSPAAPQVDPVPSPLVGSVAGGAVFSEAVNAATAAAAAIPPPVSSGNSAPQIVSGIVTSPLMIAAAHAVRATGKTRFEHNDAVHWLANEFVMVTDQDGVYYSMTNRRPLTKVVIDDLLTRYMPLNANGVPINASAIMRRYGTVHSVDSMGFYPGAAGIYVEGGRSYVNQYINPPDSIPGSAAEVALIEDFWNYCFPTEEDQIFGNYLKQCYGHVVQHPSIKIASAPLMASMEQGIGKTAIMYEIPRAIIGPNSSRQVSNKVLRGSFSDFLNGTHFVHFDEIHINGRWDSDDTANSLKNIITGTTVEIHPKGLKSFNIPNRVFVTATSNYDDAVSLPTDDERRWGVYYLRPVRQWVSEAQKAAYFTVLHKFILGPRGPGVLRWYFGQVDLTGFNPSAPPPVTQAKRDMIRKSQSTESQLILEAVDSGDAPFHGELCTFEQARQFLSAETGKTYNSLAVSHALRRALPSAVSLKQVRNTGSDTSRLPRAWAFRDTAKWEAASIDEIREAIKNLSLS